MKFGSLARAGDICDFMRCLILGLLLSTVVHGYEFVRHENAATRALAAAESQWRSAPELPAAVAPAEVAAAEVGRLLHHHLAAGFALPQDWLTNADGSVVVLLSEPGCGSVIREFTVYCLVGGYYRHTGTYRVLSRAYKWLPAATRFDAEGQGGMTLVHRAPGGSLSEIRFDFSLPTQVYRLAPSHAPITPEEEQGSCRSTRDEFRGTNL